MFLTANKKLDLGVRDPLSIDDDPDIGPRSYYLELEDDSMLAKPPRGEDSFRKGDLVVLDPDQPVRAGDYVAAVLHGQKEAIFRKYRPRGSSGGQPSYELAPLNEDYASELITKDNPARIVGRMVRSIRKY